MVRCAADTRSSENVSKEGDVRYKETLCPLKYLQEVWQSTNISGRNPIDTVLRQELLNSGTSTSSKGRENKKNRVAEKYYDCLQCAEQCRHTNPSSINPLASSKKIRNNNNNNKGNNKNNNNNNSHKSLNKNSATSKSQVICKKNPKSPPSIKSAKKNSVPATRSDSKEMKIVSNRTGQLTPVKKRSSLARPVRVHDSFVQPKRQMSMVCEKPKILQRQPNSQDSGTTGCDDGLDEEKAWPIRLPLEEMLELTLSLGKRSRRMRTRKRKRIALTSKYGHFKDTERLLKVLSVNNVDQDNRYNVKRCSVM